MEPETIPAALRRAAARWPDETAVVEDGRRTTWAELADRATEVARALVGSGVRPGDRVGLWAPNSTGWIVASMGVYAAGAILAPVNTRFTGAEAAQALRTAGAKLLFTVTDFLDTDYVQALSVDPELLGSLDVVIMSGKPDSWRDFLARGAGVDHTPAEEALTADDPSDVIFTSGTTGRPKGALLTHGSSTRTYLAWSDAVGLRHGDRYLVVYPFFHCAGLKSAVLACALRGATIVPCPVFAVNTVMSLVEKERVTMLPGPPSLYQSLLNADLSGYDRSSLRLAVTGAAAVPVELVRRMRDELGFASVVTAYGLTETTGTVTACRHDDPIEVIANTSGRPIPGMAVRIVDRDGKDVQAGEPGEVLARGFAVMRGYYGDPDATAAAIDADGWLKTGDIGVLDAAGNLRITDRIKDMFIVGGFNAYPAEIENVLLGHEGVAAVAVVGAPDERLGEVGYAFVVPRAGADPGDLLEWCRGRMANYKVPRYLEIVDELPLNRTGKVEKRVLRDRVAEALR
ncbi:FadD3 family acyl-CoA ligase [Cryptosporangium aurantiacum]|uniref:Acyl-CoA synthetase (AMP-forming)/AMP-acid ligase II n=1 Tax=Cryptosporangium aurantiacum TaxID=134849 RepID=A0A1M7RK64_9ACTN|nr:FadD3 family acyl-CoA ligase [Cryptosporangium aurantiacum]SHN46549.1 Acyl-CoA synthetase (AMP-forming)/AMP-acid ligase II [Cryptosporangium aurantiacum]